MSANTNESIVTEWVTEIWNNGQLELLGRFHPPTFDNHGRPTTIEETKQWRLKFRKVNPGQGAAKCIGRSFNKFHQVVEKPLPDFKL